jgi:putative serine protease PepD
MRRIALALLACATVVLALGLRSNSAPAGGTSLPALQAQYVRVVKSVAPSVVQIETSQGLGSGIVLDTRGDIVTNAHVVADASTFQVTLSNGRRYPATLVGRFDAGDLAVIKISAPGLHPAAFADSSKLEVGQITLAVGNPLGLQSSVTDGIVSAVGRTVSEGNGNTLPGAIQTSAPINPGNSGGALVDLAGRVIGVPTLAASDPQMGGAAVGIGFAIPSNTVRSISAQLIRFGKVENSGRAYLGVQLSGNTGGQGVLVAAVVAGGPAAKAGVRAGDVLISVNGKPTQTYDDLASVLANLKPGQSVRVGLLHPDGTRATVQVTLGTLPGA